MAVSRGKTTSLARLFDATADPVYAVDARRRILFVNKACAEWTGFEPVELLGHECRYHSDARGEGLSAVAAALCPPPACFAGEPARAAIVLPGPSQPGEPRVAEFVPLPSTAEEVAGVLAIVGPKAACDKEESGGEMESPLSVRLHGQLQQFRREMRARYDISRLLGTSPAMRRVRAQMSLAAASTASVVVQGPHGSGRQHVARAIHFGFSSKPSKSSDSSESPPALVPLECSLLGAELVVTTMRALASSGLTNARRPATLLLIDVDELPPETYPELIRSLSEHDAAFRVVATTVSPLLQLTNEGHFSRELACLLGTLTISLPPLAKRLEDLPLLAQSFLEQSNAQSEKQLTGFTPEALECLLGYPWPGHVAELAEFVSQAHAQADGPYVTPGDLPKTISLAAQAAAVPHRVEETIVLEKFLGEMERELIERALARAKGNKTRAAKLLGMTRPRLYRRLVQLGLDDGRG